MILGLGVDLVEIERIGELIERHGDHFLRKTFTAGEQAYCAGKAKAAQHYAARFAAKEAAMKALGTGWQEGIGFLSIEVANNTAGAPELRLHAQALRRAESMGVSKTHVSLSHAESHAMAQVLLEGNPA